MEQHSQHSQHPPPLPEVRPQPNIASHHNYTATCSEGGPGDVVTTSSADDAASLGAGGGAGGDGFSRLEDLPGVSTDAWLRVTRGLPPSDPFTPGDGFVVCVDSGRLMPANCTVTRVQVRGRSRGGEGSGREGQRAAGRRGKGCGGGAEARLEPPLPFPTRPVL